MGPPKEGLSGNPKMPDCLDLRTVRHYRKPLFIPDYQVPTSIAKDENMMDYIDTLPKKPRPLDKLPKAA